MRNDSTASAGGRKATACRKTGDPACQQYLILNRKKQLLIRRLFFISLFMCMCTEMKTVGTKVWRRQLVFECVWSNRESLSEGMDLEALGWLGLPRLKTVPSLCDQVVVDIGLFWLVPEWSAQIAVEVTRVWANGNRQPSEPTQRLV